MTDTTKPTLAEAADEYSRAGEALRDCIAHDAFLAGARHVLMLEEVKGMRELVEDYLNYVKYEYGNGNTTYEKIHSGLAAFDRLVADAKGEK